MKEIVNNYLEYCNRLEHSEMWMWDYSIFYNLNKVSLSYLSDSSNFSNSIGMLSKSLGLLTYTLYKKDDRLFENITKTWWIPQFTITSTNDELNMLKSYLDRIGEKLYIETHTRKRSENHLSSIKKDIELANLSLVSICLNNQFSPIEVLQNSI